MSEEESTQIIQFGQAAGALIHRCDSVCFWCIDPPLEPEVLVLLPVSGDVHVQSYLLHCWSMSLGVASFIIQCPS